MNLLFALISFPLDSSAALYGLLFVGLWLSGIGLPVPEEVMLILGGYLSYLEFIHYKYALVVLTLGVIVSDISGYSLGRFAGEKITGFLSRLRVPLAFLDKAKKYFEKYGAAVILFSRPLLGVRIVVPILAGHFRVNFPKFLFYDILGAIIWTLLIVSISYYFGLGLDLITEIREIKHAVFLGVGVLIFLVAGFKFFRVKEYFK